MSAEKEFSTIFDDFCKRMSFCIKKARQAGVDDAKIIEQILYVLDGEYEKTNQESD